MDWRVPSGRFLEPIACGRIRGRLDGFQTRRVESLIALSELSLVFLVNVVLIEVRTGQLKFIGNSSGWQRMKEVGGM